MEKDKKKKMYNGKKKISKDKSFDDKQKTHKASKITNLSCPQNLGQTMNLKYLNFGYIPINIYEIQKIEEKKDSKKSKEDNFYEIITKRKEEMKLAHKKIDIMMAKRKEVIDLINEIYEKIKKERNYKFGKINECKEEIMIIENLRNEIKQLEEVKEKAITQKDAKKKRYESSFQTKPDNILFTLQALGEKKMF